MHAEPVSCGLLSGPVGEWLLGWSSAGPSEIRFGGTPEADIPRTAKDSLWCNDDLWRIGQYTWQANGLTGCRWRHKTVWIDLRDRLRAYRCDIET